MIKQEIFKNTQKKNKTIIKENNNIDKLKDDDDNSLFLKI